MVSSTLCPAVHILGSQNVYGRAEGIAEHYWPWAVFLKILLAVYPKGMMLYRIGGEFPSVPPHPELQPPPPDPSPPGPQAPSPGPSPLTPGPSPLAPGPQPSAPSLPLESPCAPLTDGNSPLLFYRTLPPLGPLPSLRLSTMKGLAGASNGQQYPLACCAHFRFSNV